MLNADTTLPLRTTGSSAPANGTDLLSLGDRRLSWLEKRQQVLAGNLANADTPDYAPHDISPFQSALAAQEITPVRTDPAHFGVGDDDIETNTRATSEHSINGNSVSIEHEMEEVANVNDQQHFAVNVYARYTSMFQTALGK